MIIVRDITPRDVPACAAIFDAARKDAFSEPLRATSVAAFALETGGEAVIVALCAGHLCGFASIYMPESFLHHLYVDPSRYRQRIGSTLLQEAVRRIPGRLNLKCRASNERARRFYAAHGFIEGECGNGDEGPWVRLTAPP